MLTPNRYRSMSKRPDLRRHSDLVTASRHDLAVQRMRRISLTAEQRPTHVHMAVDHSTKANAVHTLRREHGFRKVQAPPSATWIEAQQGKVSHYLRRRAGRRHSTHSATPPASREPGGVTETAKHIKEAMSERCMTAPHLPRHPRSRPRPTQSEKEYAQEYVHAHYDMMRSLRAYYKVASATEEHGAQHALQGADAHFSDAALLQRESLRFDPGVLRQLSRLWDMTDVNNDGNVDLAEYVDMVSASQSRRRQCYWS